MFNIRNYAKLAFSMVLVGLIQATAISGKTFYVSSIGNDSGDGSQANPWRTLARASSAQLNPGDALALEGGAHFSGTLTITHSGTSGVPIHILSYQSSKGSRAEIVAGNADALVIQDAEYIEVANLKMTGSGTASNNGHGILLTRKIAGPSSALLDHD